MNPNYLPDDHKARLRRRIENNAEIKALRAEMKKLDKKRKPLQFKIGNIRNQLRHEQLVKYRAELALRSQRKAARRALGLTGEAKITMDNFCGQSPGTFAKHIEEQKTYETDQEKKRDTQRPLHD